MTQNLFNNAHSESTNNPSMEGTQKQRALNIRALALEIAALAEGYVDGNVKCLTMEKAVVSRLNGIVRNLSPFATEDEAIETSGTYQNL